MKAVRFFGVLALSVMLLQGCDFFRSVLGKPTSADLQAVKEAAERQKAEAERRAADSLALLLAAETDSVTVRKADDAVSLPESGHRFYVIAGSFKVPSNAENFTDLAKKNGLSAEKIKMGNGFTAVAIYGTENIRDAVFFANDAQKYDFVPLDPWILDVSKFF